MKRLIACMALLTVSSVWADSYKAPQFKMPTGKTVDSKAQKAHWDDESHFRVQESPEAERDLASSPERESDWAKPNEVREPAAKKDEPKIIPWKMMKP